VIIIGVSDTCDVTCVRGSVQADRYVLVPESMMGTTVVETIEKYQ
jgi:hypothetical protein